MQAACFGQEDPLVGGDCRTPIQQVTESRDLGTGRMDTSLGLVELLRIAKQDNAGRGLGHCQHVGERHLTRLVHEEHVHGVSHILASPQPRRSCGDLCGTSGQGVRERLGCPSLVSPLDARHSSPSLAFWTALRRTPASVAALHTSRSRLLITLWLTAVIPTRRPCLTSSTIMRAPVNVLPEPGGPWIGSTEASRGSDCTRVFAASVSC